MNRSSIGLLLLVFAGAATAADDIRPASFDHEESDRRMDTLVEFPEVKGKISVILSCFSQIQSSGKMKETGCFTKDQYDQPFAMAVNKAAKKARMNPAIIDGKPRKIFLQFRVEFIAEDDDRDIYFYQNPGYEENVKAYGYDHVAGQRVIGSKEPWNDACPKRAKYAVWARAYLGEDGRADNPSVSHGSGIVPTSACQEAIKQTVLTSRYTPALADGEPVPSTYVEIFGN